MNNGFKLKRIAKYTIAKFQLANQFIILAQTF